MREQKLIRLAFDPFTTWAENESAWLKLLDSLKKRGVTGYQLEGFKTGFGQLFDKSAYFSELGHKNTRHETGQRTGQESRCRTMG